MNSRELGRKPKLVTATVAAGLTTLLLVPATHAFEFDTGGSEFKARWDNTIKYSSAWRLKEPSASIIARRNNDDGDRNFDKGQLVSSRWDLLSELDVSYKDFGARVSAAAWRDAVYLRSNHNDSPASVSYTSVQHTEFPGGTKDMQGHRSELLDAFIYGNARVGELPASFRAGRHTVLWGESLLMADNGIAYAQAPLDVIKAISVPGSQAKELFMPVGQISGQIGLTPNLSIAVYSQFEWQKVRLPAAGAYLNTTDFSDMGADRIFLGATPLGRRPDVSASDSGQWGISTRYRAEAIDTEFGVYYLRFHSKEPTYYVQPSAGRYFAVFPEDITAAGASATTNIGGISVGGEAHVRRNTPLFSSVVLPTGVQPSLDDPRHAIGNTVHAQANVLYVLPSTSLWNSASLLAEVGGHHVTSITKNAAARDIGRDLTAWGFRANFTPTYYQVMPALDLSVPISLSYNPKGKSPVFGSFNGGGHKGGSITVGLATDYQKTWTSGLQVTHYWGKDDFQARQDRDFVSVQVQRTF